MKLWELVVLIICIVTVSVVILGWAEKRDQKLLEMCADHNTQTLYECK